MTAKADRSNARVSGGSLRQLRLELLSNGYIPLPAKGKAPEGIVGWQSRSFSDPDVRGWSKQFPHHTNTGVRTGSGLLAVDVDVRDERVAKQLQHRLETMMPEGGALPPLRIGNAPKFLMPFRSDYLGEKITGRGWIDRAGRTARVEVLVQGQQFIAFGTHPDTGKPYEWVEGVSPLEVAADELPSITEYQLREFIAYAECVFEREGWTVAESAKRPGQKLDAEKLLNQIRTGAVFHEFCNSLCSTLRSDWR